ncbi:MAG: Omp28-related outer membrane protein [Aureispira sp.]|nr:Omp28-related outer membrane protein [Aureispira sp.]
MRNFLFLLILVGTLSFYGCEEIPPVIEPCKTNRVVLVEEFTGVQCVNCPAGSERIEQLIAQNPGKIVAVSIHAGFFAKPINPTDEDFKTDETEALDALLGPVSGWPAATINRKLFDNESQLVLGLSSWAGYIGNELCYPGVVDMDINSTVNTSSNEATINISLTPTNSVPLDEDVSLSVMITESNIKAPQITPDGKVYDYKHKHLMRKMLTSINGIKVQTAGNALDAYSTEFTYGLPEHWDAENCHVIAFLHYSGTSSKKDVLQAFETDLAQ